MAVPQILAAQIARERAIPAPDWESGAYLNFAGRTVKHSDIVNMTNMDIARNGSMLAFAKIAGPILSAIPATKLIGMATTALSYGYDTVKLISRMRENKSNDAFWSEYNEAVKSVQAQSDTERIATDFAIGSNLVSGQSLPANVKPIGEIAGGLGQMAQYVALGVLGGTKTFIFGGAISNALNEANTRMGYGEEQGAAIRAGIARGIASGVTAAAFLSLAPALVSRLGGKMIDSEIATGLVTHPATNAVLRGGEFAGWGAVEPYALNTARYVAGLEPENNESSPWVTGGMFALGAMLSGGLLKKSYSFHRPVRMKSTGDKEYMNFAEMAAAKKSALKAVNDTVGVRYFGDITTPERQAELMKIAMGKKKFANPNAPTYEEVADFYGNIKIPEKAIPVPVAEAKTILGESYFDLPNPERPMPKEILEVIKGIKDKKTQSDVSASFMRILDRGGDIGRGQMVLSDMRKNIEQIVLESHGVSKKLTTPAALEKVGGPEAALRLTTNDEQVIESAMSELSTANRLIKQAKEYDLSAQSFTAERTGGKVTDTFIPDAEGVARKVRIVDRFDQTEDAFYAGKNLHGSFADPRKGRASSGDTGGFFTTESKKHAEWYASSPERNEVAGKGNIYAAEQPKNPIDLREKKNWSGIVDDFETALVELDKKTDGMTGTIEKKIKQLKEMIAADAPVEGLVGKAYDISMEYGAKTSKQWLDTSLFTDSIRRRGHDAWITTEKIPGGSSDRFKTTVYLERPELSTYKEAVQKAIEQGKSVPDHIKKSVGLGSAAIVSGLIYTNLGNDQWDIRETQWLTPAVASRLAEMARNEYRLSRDRQASITKAMNVLPDDYALNPDNYKMVYDRFMKLTGGYA